MDKVYTVYLLTNRKNGTLYVGVTSDLPGRIHQHRAKIFPGFTARYGLHRLVWHEEHRDIHAAIAREKALKRWNRQWKIDLIAAANPDWHDLAVPLLGFPVMESAVDDAASAPGGAG